MRRLPLICLLGALGTFASLGDSGAVPPVEQPLVNLHSRLRFQLVKSSLSGEDLLVTRAGTTVGGVTFLADTLSAFWTASSNAGRASSGQLALLNGALVAANAGLQKDCAITQVGGWSGTYEISWYGRGARANNFVVTVQFLSSPLQECPAAVADLLKAIERFGGEVLGVTPVSPFSE